MALSDLVQEKSGAVSSYVENLNSKAIDKLEAIAHQNLSTIAYLNHASIKQLRSLTSVRDAESLRQFFSDTMTLGGDLLRRTANNTRGLFGTSADTTEKASQFLTHAAAEKVVITENLKSDPKRKAI